MSTPSHSAPKGSREHRRVVRRSRLLIFGSAAVAVAAVLTVAGISSATANTKTEHFSFIDTSTNQSSAVYSAIATGAFAAGGTSSMIGRRVTVQFPAGTITLSIEKSHSHKRKSPACVQVKSSSGRYTISGGTGVYKGISGSGNSTVSITFVEPTIDGNCSTTPDAVQALIAADGPISLP